VDSDIDEQEDAFEGGLEASPFDSPKGGHGYFNNTKDEGLLSLVVVKLLETIRWILEQDALGRVSHELMVRFR